MTPNISAMPMKVLRRWRVLLIDDSELTLELQTDILSSAGFDVRACSAPSELEKALQSWAPELILTDVTMPGMTGVELCQILKRRYETAHVPIVLCSGMAPADLSALADECGADGFVCKADGLDALPAELRMLCESFVW